MENKPFLHIVLLIGVASILIRALLNYDFGHSALLYVGIPYLIALSLLAFTSPENTEENWKNSYLNLLRGGFIVFFASSIVLFEGFLCVVMFIPIYLIILTLAFVIELIVRKYKKQNNNNMKVMLLPALALFTALEGTTKDLSFSRDQVVSQSVTTTQSASDIKANLISPITVSSDTNWLLQIFPMPYRIEAETLAEGDVHSIYYRYKRWFFTNTHEGVAKLKLSAIKDNGITTEFIEDSSYISNYLKIQGTEIKIEPMGQTNKITLTIRYERKLDPAWYFEPIQRYAMSNMAKILLRQVIVKDPNAIAVATP